MLQYLLFLSLFSASFVLSEDTISPFKSIKDVNSTLVSSGQVYELGFFSPEGSENRYVGIWHKHTPDQVVWVANRNAPLSDRRGEFTIRDGNIVLLDAEGRVVWSTNSTGTHGRIPVAVLLDSGNLVLKESVSFDDPIWQSFDHPTDTLIVGMKLGWDLRTGLERYLTSWKSVDDPSTGEYTYRIEINGLAQGVLEMGSVRTFRTGVWNGVRFSGLQKPIKTVFQTAYVFDDEEAYVSFEQTDDNYAVPLLKQSSLGQQQLFILRKGNKRWEIMYSVPSELPCGNYNYCGANSKCTNGGAAVCICLKGFTPKAPQDWMSMRYSEGCKRSLPLDCEGGDGFLKFIGLKLPDLLMFRFNKNTSLHECKEACFRNCSCTAYASVDARGVAGCSMWFGDLIDMSEVHVEGNEQEIYVRISSSEIKSIHDKKMEIAIATSLTVSICILCIAYWGLTKRRRRCRDEEKLVNSLSSAGRSYDESSELPFFDLLEISSATHHFSLENMIGKGGFGTVYKGKLCTGQEIAVKRLSMTSGQGLEEFKNEVELIAKLQHRNLVALVGYCAQGDERMLVYEYMANRSLDKYIFDREGNRILPWKTYFDIVKGVARGLLYLHRDSKLQIVHRDFKASNILLDHDLKPKISDFGLARTFGDDEKELKTMRVVGTIGYMAPEYAIDGKFSTKSDVFSFGVVLLEIVSGKKNRNFQHQDHNHNLLGHVWLLWMEERSLEVMEECLKGSCVESQVLRCIHVALLCVQKFPQDRPAMSSVVFMLENETAVLPCPREPGFFFERSAADDSSEWPTHGGSYSPNAVTITMMSGRS